MAAKIKDLPAKELVKGITGHYAHGSSMTLGYVEIEEGSNLPSHNHVHEQITYILEGELDMVIGGISYSLTAGMYHVIPSNIPHSAIAKTKCKLMTSSTLYGKITDKQCDKCDECDKWNLEL